jgi:hypothetical protein
MDRDRWLAARAASRAAEPVPVVTDATVRLRADGSATVSVQGDSLWSPGGLPDVVVGDVPVVRIKLDRDGNLRGELTSWPRGDHMALSIGSQRFDAKVTTVVKPSTPAWPPFERLERALASVMSRIWRPRR